MTEEASRQIKRNHHMKACLAYYIGFFHPPRYAVLLNGAWGIVKKFLLKAFLKSLQGNNFRPSMKREWNTKLEMRTPRCTTWISDIQ